MAAHFLFAASIVVIIVLQLSDSFRRFRHPSIPDPRSRPKEPTMYVLTLAQPDGRLLAEIPNAPFPTRFVHISDEELVVLNDDPNPPNGTVQSFARVASAVWGNEAGDTRSALYVTVES